MGNMMTIAEAAKTLGCTTSNIYQLIKKRGIETVSKPMTIRKTIVRTVMVKRVDVDKLATHKGGE